MGFFGDFDVGRGGADCHGAWSGRGGVELTQVSPTPATSLPLFVELGAAPLACFADTPAEDRGDWGFQDVAVEFRISSLYVPGTGAVCGRQLDIVNSHQRHCRLVSLAREKDCGVCAWNCVRDLV